MTATSNSEPRKPIISEAPKFGKLGKTKLPALPVFNLLANSINANKFKAS